ncbi:MAG TPA: hypothetical protein VM241_02220 [Candidatus Thermoplasmatota archaeon]|nr:hypothetical protein [Candidatus Thermoplasmatota archaeon]
MGSELTGILSGTGAKMKGEVGEGEVSFRGAFKADVPFEEIVAEARGTLLVLSCRGHVVELGAGAKAGALAAKIRSPPSRLDRLGVQAGMTAAVAGPLDAAFKAELGARAVVAPGAPRQPVDALFFAVESAAQLEPLPKLSALVAAGGSLWVVTAKGKAPTEAQVAAAAKAAGLRPQGSAVRVSEAQVAARFVHPA